VRILITGATGLVGKEIVKLCHNEGIAINYLTTSKSKLTYQDNYKGFYWNPDANQIDINCFEGVEVIINLVGATISKRWTDSYKIEVLKSRTRTAQLLKATIDKHSFPIKHIVSASAIGIYPSSLINYYDETNTEVSTSFLGKVVYDWEKAVDEFEQSGITVCKIRIGLVLAKNGGALPEIIKPMKFGAGAAFGSGDQWQSWIHVNDLARLFLFALKQNLKGTLNAVAPNPVTNAEFTKIVAKVMQKPLILPNIPKFLMKLVLGEMHILLFESQRVSSKKIEDTGFEFNYVHLEPALTNLLQNVK
jgi:uncharacterized protein (TIGR01777 family)